jgi:Spy/CpxP family protein refolding chaperone
MKKFLFLSLIFSAVISTTTYAQAGGSQAAGLQQMQEKVKPQMVEKTGLTDAQAAKVIEINFDIRQAAMGLRDLSEADRSKKVAELKATKEKKYSEIPLTAEQIKAVYAFYEEMGRNMAPKSGN